MKRSTILLGVLVAVLALAAAAPVASARGGGGRFVAAGLKGANEVSPVVGDLDGAGFALIQIDRSERTVCVEDAAFGGIDAPTLFHIHRGTADVNGPVVVDFTGLLASENVGCVAVNDLPLLNAIRNHPERYYVNVHTAANAAGAIRGQLVTVQP